MTRFVLDSSFAMSWAFHDERTPERLRVLNALAYGRAEALVSPLWFFEISNVLLVAERRKRLSVDQSAAFIVLLKSLPIRVEGNVVESFGPLLDLARAKKLTVYDAAYLEVAVQAGKVPLATLDEALETAARGNGIPGISDLLAALPTAESGME
jgi:predicted nucleic acid-binding protein